MCVQKSETAYFGLTVLLLIGFGFNGVCCRSGYVLTFPQELQVGADEKFCLNLYNISNDINININISCYGREVTHTPDTFHHGQSRCFQWQIPDTLPAGTCGLDLQGEDDLGEYVFTETRKVEVVDNYQITFIQTDKPIYKPGDRVRFRIMTVTQELLPVQDNVESVTVMDPSGIYMKQWLDVSVQAGLLSLDYRLYNEPVLGVWKIVAETRGKKTEQEFSIQQYVLPRFQVYSQLPTGLTVATKSIQFEVCAKYTFGKPVEGNLNASVCLHNTKKSWFCEESNRPCVNVHTQINGCHSFTVETKQLDITARQFSLLCKPLVRLNASVTEKQTGVTVEESVDGTGVWEERVKLKIYANKYFKPFFPYVGKVYAWKPDGSPAMDEEVILKIGKLGISTRLVTDDTGYAYFNINNLTQSTQYFVVEAKTTDVAYTDKKLYTIYPAKTRKHVKQWYSPTFSYLQLSSAATNVSSAHKCGDTVAVDVVYSHADDTQIQSVAYQFISKGNILSSADLMEELEGSKMYVPRPNGPVIFPNLPSKPLETDLEIVDSIIPQPGPQGFDSKVPDVPSGPPGSKPMSRGPPGKRNSGGVQAPVPSLDNIDVSSQEDKKSNVDLEGKELLPVRPVLRQFTMNVILSETMSPKVRILVTMVTTDGEIAADTIDLDIEHCHRNKVEMTFNKASTRPGETVDLTLSAEPHSLCATGSVDKSVYLLGGLNLLQEKHINEKLQEFDLTSDFLNDWQYCSDMSILPPDFSEYGPPQFSGSPGMTGSPGMADVTDNLYDNFERKRRSIMQYHSNMYDSLLAFKAAGLTVMTDLDLLTRPCLHEGDILGPPHMPGDPIGPIPGQGNLNIEALEPTEEPTDTRAPVSNLRRNFPETWLWELYEIPASGSVTFTEVLPDTITEWVGNSVCFSEQTGVGVSEVAKVTTFQPFFMSVKLPYSVMRGEVINVDVVVFNYLPHCIALQVEMIKSSSFTNMGSIEEGQFCICGEQADSTTFKIKPDVLGKVTITFSAFLREHRVSCREVGSPTGYKNKQVTELVVRHLLIKPEGLEEEHTFSKFICPQGDIMGPVFSGLEELIQLPMGCGEQNMVRLAPDIAILQYLTATGQLTDDVEVITLDHLHKGFQQQMKFMHADGSYSAFGTADERGSTWLSAFVFKSLRQALNYIFIDRKQLQTNTWEFLLNQQGEDGCFQEHGKVLGKYMMGGIAGSSDDKKRALTSYVLVAMLESFQMMRERTPPFISLAVRCVQVENMTDTYTHALMAYAMALYKPESRFTELIINRLKEKARRKDDMMYWKREKQPDILSGQGRAASAEIEMTSYALLAILTRDKNTPVSEVIPIVNWLTSQRNAYGGFASTQDTVVALQALSLFAQRIYGDGLDVGIKIVDNSGVTRHFYVGPKNNIILQQKELANPNSDLHITAEGEGCIMLQWTSKYNVKNKVMPDDTFKLTVTTPVTQEMFDMNCMQRKLEICVSYEGPDGVSNMAVVEVKVPSGWIADINSLQKLLNSVELGLKKYEIDERYADVVNFYFDQFDGEELCFDFTILLEMVVEEQQPAIAKVIDYYETGEQTSVFFKMSSCTPSSIEAVVDVSITGQTDNHEQNINRVAVNHNHITNAAAASGAAAPMVEEDDISEDNNEVPPRKPSSRLACPQCHTTGTVDVLKDICLKQVWTLDAQGKMYTLRVLAADGISPDLEIPAPELLHQCLPCQPFLGQHGLPSLVFLAPYTWTDLGANIVQDTTVLIPWSESLQTSLQEILKTCVQY